MAESAIDGSAEEVPVMDEDEIRDTLDPEYGLVATDDSESDFSLDDIISQHQLDYVALGFPDTHPEEAPPPEDAPPEDG
jgi:hypothetical protein